MSHDDPRDDAERADAERLRRFLEAEDGALPPPEDAEVVGLFAEAGGGTLLTYTEQGAWFAPGDGVEGRREGWETLLAALERVLDATARRAAE